MCRQPWYHHIQYMQFMPNWPTIKIIGYQMVKKDLNTKAIVLAYNNSEIFCNYKLYCLSISTRYSKPYVIDLKFWLNTKAVANVQSPILSIFPLEHRCYEPHPGGASGSLDYKTCPNMDQPIRTSGQLLCNTCVCIIIRCLPYYYNFLWNTMPNTKSLLLIHTYTHTCPQSRFYIHSMMMLIYPSL